MAIMVDMIAIMTGRVAIDDNITQHPLRVGSPQVTEEALLGSESPVTPDPV